MTPEREKLIRDTWAGVRGWPVAGPAMRVPVRAKLEPLNHPLDPGALLDISERILVFERGVEYSDDDQWRRVYVECEGLRVHEQIERRLRRK